MQISPIYSYQDDRPEIQFGRVNFELEKVDEALKAYTANPNEQLQMLYVWRSIKLK